MSFHFEHLGSATKPETSAKLERKAEYARDWLAILLGIIIVTATLAFAKIIDPQTSAKAEKIESTSKGYQFHSCDRISKTLREGLTIESKINLVEYNVLAALNLTNYLLFNMACSKFVDNGSIINPGK